MKIAGLSTSNVNGVQQAVANASGLLYRELFRWAQENDSVSIVNNSILIHLGLIKVCVGIPKCISIVMALPYVI